MLESGQNFGPIFFTKKCFESPETPAWPGPDRIIAVAQQKLGGKLNFMKMLSYDQKICWHAERRITDTGLSAASE